MKRIRAKRRIDRLRTETRASGTNWGRWVYLGLVALLALWLLDTAFGQYIYLRAEGMVTQDKHVVAMSNIATVEAIHVEEGQQVSGGELLAKVTSFPIVQQIANLSTKLADIHARQLELKARRLVLHTILPVAKRRVEAMERLRSNEESAIARGLTDTRKLNELLQDEFASILDSERMQAEVGTIDGQLRDLESMATRLTQTLDQIDAAYEDGVIRSPVDGRVVNITASLGSVLSVDDSLMEVLTGEAYVLAYIKPGTLYSVHGGENVTLRYGLSKAQGRVEAILPFSAKLPNEFQRTFRPRERSQIARIELESDDRPPTYTKVEVVSASILWHELKSAVAGLFSSAGGAEQTAHHGRLGHRVAEQISDESR